MGSSQLSMANLLITISLWLHPLLVSGSEINCDEGGREMGPAGSGKCSGKIGSFWKSPIFFASFLKSKKIGWPIFLEIIMTIVVWKSSSKMIIVWINCWLPNNKTMVIFDDDFTGTQRFETRDKWFKWWLANPKNLGNWSSLCSIKPI